MDLLHSLMPGETDMAVRMRGKDWSGTGLGEPARWPASLRSAVRICLTSQLPIFVGWGRQFSLVYNDGCIPLLGTGRHPAALGQPARESFPDQWDRLHPLLEALMTTGEGQRPHLLLLEQSVNLCCSPILAEDGLTVQGVFCPCFCPCIRQVDHSEELQATEAQFLRFFDLGLVGMALTTPGKRCLDVNAELCRMLGYSREEMLRGLWSELTHPDDLQADIAQFERVMAGEIDGYTLDKRWIRKDGQVLYTTMSANSLRASDGTVQFFIGLVQDITARHAAEEALRRSEANLAHAQRISHSGSWSWDAASGHVFCSQETLRIFGLDSAEHQDWCTFLRMIHPDDLEAVECTFEHALATASPYEIDYRILRRDGSMRHLVTEAQPVLDVSGQLSAFVGTAMDVTERRQAQEQLSESENRFRQLIEAIPHHVWSMRAGPDGGLDGASLGYCNQRMSDYTGLSLEQLRSGNRAALHPDDVEEWRKRWAAALADGAEYQMETRMRARDGSYRRFVSRAVPVHHGENQPIEWFGTNSDVEDRARSEEALRQLQTELARVMRATTLGELAASIAHEINQPLASMGASGNACLRWLAASPPNLAEAASAARQVVYDATRAGDIVLRIRKFLQRGTETSGAVDLAAVVGDVATMVQAQLQARKTMLRVTAAPQLPWVRADRIQLQQVVLNLLVNAMDAMTESQAGSRCLQLDIGLHGKGDAQAVVVAVKDRGVGLAAEEVERIFDAFYTTKPSGMGMGLTISRSIIEAHGGRMWVSRNADGPGVTVSFKLPATRRGD